jgi:hypothetical protein
MKTLKQILKSNKIDTARIYRNNTTTTIYRAGYSRGKGVIYFYGINSDKVLEIVSDLNKNGIEAEIGNPDEIYIY